MSWVKIYSFHGIHILFDVLSRLSIAGSSLVSARSRYKNLDDEDVDKRPAGQQNVFDIGINDDDSGEDVDCDNDDSGDIIKWRKH